MDRSIELPYYYIYQSRWDVDHRHGSIYKQGMENEIDRESPSRYPVLPAGGVGAFDNLFNPFHPWICRDDFQRKPGGTSGSKNRTGGG